jgi:ABC-type sugar transport system ATPase subunit
MTDGDPCLLGVRPQLIRIDGDGPIVGEVVDLETLGFGTDVSIRAGEHEIRVRIEGGHGLGIGSKVRITIDPGSCHLFPPG